MMSEVEPGAPHLSVEACCARGDEAVRAKRFEAAIDHYEAALALDPRHRTARINLSLALRGAGRLAEAEAVLLALAAEAPADAFLCNQLGKIHVLAENFTEALAWFQRAVACDPQDSDSLYWIGGVRHAMGDLKAAEAGYAKAARVQTLFRRAAARGPAAFSVLMLCAPVAANMPAVYLTDEADYASLILLLLPDADYDVAALRQSGQLLLNLVSDADQAAALLPLAADLVDRIGLPVVNHPRKVMQTRRETIAQRLGSIAGCRVAATLRLAAGADAEVEARAQSFDLSFPLLVRPAGTHGGENFEKCDTAAALSACLARHPQEAHYLIHYIDYASPDGHYRKYRFMFIEDGILPYHLAIGDHWKVHHATTDMLNQAWMRSEESAFLADPGAVFTPQNYQALGAIRALIDLDVFGIDCGLDRDGALVVFEVNASMLVHPHNEDFPYKMPYVRAIKRAFDAMLGKRALAVD